MIRQTVSSVGIRRFVLFLFALVISFSVLLSNRILAQDLPHPGVFLFDEKGNLHELEKGSGQRPEPNAPIPTTSNPKPHIVSFGTDISKYVMFIPLADAKGIHVSIYNIDEKTTLYSAFQPLPDGITCALSPQNEYHWCFRIDTSNHLKVLPPNQMSDLKGKIAFYSNRDGTVRPYLMNANGSELHPLTNDVAEMSVLYKFYTLAWSLDGKQLAYSSMDQIYVINVDSPSQPTRLTKDGRNLWAAWSPDGKQIAFVSMIGDDLVTALSNVDFQINVVSVDGSNRRALAKGIHPVWLPDGKHILFSDMRKHYYMNSDGSDVRPFDLFKDFHGDLNPMWSPDGSKIAISRGATTKYYPRQNIWIMNNDGSNPQAITQTDAERSPAWSPDGKYIVFSSERDGSNEIYVMNVDGSNQRRLTDNPAQDFAPSWQPTGGSGQPVVQLPSPTDNTATPAPIISTSVPIAQTPNPCPLGSIFVDDRKTGGMVSGKVYGTPCDAILEIKNERQYWINLSASGQGRGVTMPTPENQIYDHFHVLPPSGVARYRVNFSAQAQAVTVVVNSTDQNAQYMNLARALVDYIVLGSLVVPCKECAKRIGEIFEQSTEAIPTIIGLIDRSTYLKQAAEALARGDRSKLQQALWSAIQNGEMEQLFKAIAKFSGATSAGVDVADLLVRGSDKLKSSFDTTAKVAAVFVPALEVIYRNYSNAAQFAFLPQSGLLIFEAQIAEAP